MRQVLTNSFHNTKAVTTKTDAELDEIIYQAACGHSDDTETKRAKAFVRRMHNKLCGAKGCTCGDSLGRR